MLPCRTPSVEIHMAEALIWGFSCAVNHCQVPTEGDDRKGFYFTPCSGGRIRSGLGDICVSVIVHFNSLIASNFGSRGLKFSSVWTLIWFISPLIIAVFVSLASKSLNIRLWSFTWLMCSFFFLILAPQQFDSPLQRGPALPSLLWSRAHRRSFHRKRMRGTRRTGGTGW